MEQRGCRGREPWPRQSCSEHPFLSYACEGFSRMCPGEGQLCWGPFHTLPDISTLFFQVIHFSGQVRKLRPRKSTVTYSESLRVWARFPVQGPWGPSTLPFRNRPFPYFYFSTNPSDHPGSVIRADLGETHYQHRPGGLGIWKCFGEEMGKKLTLENSPGGSKVQNRAESLERRGASRGRWGLFEGSCGSLQPSPRCPTRAGGFLMSRALSEVTASAPSGASQLPKIGPQRPPQVPTFGVQGLRFIDWLSDF